ncbi:MAG: hypothetical protein CMJ42_07050 [Phyllobacteriaceae bacterium]|nr:hypothetical protein [Phyllobacteriaceae bacterium]MBA91277.1 hypothetical protein [Phyllobacteriaceae bacterium]
MSGIETLLQNIDGLTPLTVALVLLAGLVVGIAPSSFPLIAVATGLGAGEGTNATDNARMRGFACRPVSRSGSSRSISFWAAFSVLPASRCCAC